MSTRSGRNYAANRLSQQQCDNLLLELVNQVGNLSKRMDTVWTHLF